MRNSEEGRKSKQISLQHHKEQEKSRASHQAEVGAQTSLAGSTPAQPMRLTEAERLRQDLLTQGLHSVYQAQLSLMNDSAKAVANKLDQLRVVFSWQGLAQAESSLDVMQDKLGALNQAWVEYLTSMTDLGLMQQASVLGKAQLKEVADHMGRLRQELSRVNMPQEQAHQPGVQPPPPAAPSQTPHTEQQPRIVKPKVKLENIHIPKFTGNILDYPDFQATFKALTSDEGYKEEVLLIYLKDALPSSAWVTGGSQDHADSLVQAGQQIWQQPAAHSCCT